MNRRSQSSMGLFPTLALLSAFAPSQVGPTTVQAQRSPVTLLHGVQQTLLGVQPSPASTFSVTLDDAVHSSPVMSIGNAGRFPPARDAPGLENMDP